MSRSRHAVRVAVAAVLIVSGAAAHAGTLTNVAPAGTSAGLTAKVFGTGFNPTAGNNRVRLTPAGGAPVDVIPTAIAIADKANLIYSLTFRVPDGFPAGPAAIAVTNTVTGEVSEGRSIEIVALQLPEVTSGARGTTSLVVRITGTANANFISANTRVLFGAGITVTSTAIDSATSLRATIDIAGNAALGARSPVVTTPSQTIALTNGFLINDPAPANRAPVAQPGGPYSAKTGEAIAFNGSTSSDPDSGDTITYSWSFGDNSPAANGATPQHTFQNAGTFPIALTVTDNHGLSHTASTTATISAAPPPPTDTTAPFVTLSGPTQGLAGAQVTITASASDNVGIAKVQFLVDGSNATEDTAPPYERVFTIPADAQPGTTFTIKAIASDAAGNSGAREAAITVAAVPDTTDPTVALNTPPHAAAGASVVVSATATDNIGIASVAFLANDETIATITAPPFQASYTIPAGAAAGTLITIKARATDTSGHTAQDTADITVVEAPDTTPPTIEVSAPAQVGAGRTLLVSAAASDNVGVSSVQFFVDEVLIATDTEAPYDASFPVPATLANGVALQIRARALDYSNRDATDETSVSILANRLPTANAGGPYTVQLGDLLELKGNASTDPDNDALTYAWQFGDGSHGTGPSPTHAFATSGPFTVTLTVSDGRGGSATATASVAVTAIADRAPPAIALVGPSRVLPGTEATITAQVSDNVAVTDVTFTVNGAQQTVASAAPFTRLVEIPAVAAPDSTLVVRGTAKDAAGNSSSAQLTLTITASPDTQPPTVSMRLPEQTAAGATLLVGASADDNSGVKSVAFFAGDTPIGIDTAPPFEATFTVPAGAAAGSTLAFSARAADFSDNTGEASGSVLVAQTGDTTPPTVSLAAAATVAAGGTLTLTADAKDNSGIASVEFFVDAVRVGVDTSAPYQFAYTLPAGRLPGALLRLQARALDFAQLEATASGESRVTAAGQGVVAGEVFDAKTGLPLGGASIALAGKDALGRDYSATATSDARGRYLLRAHEGSGRLVIAKAGWTSVERAVAVTTGRAVEPVDARLTPLAPATTIQPLAGGLIAQNGHEAALPGGALATAAALRLTPIGSQALQSLLPGGWSPLAALDLHPRGITFASPVAIRAPQPHALPIGTEVLLARWDEQQALWRAVAVVPVTGDGQTVAGEITATGQYAWLLPDSIPAAPPVPAAGLEVGGVEIAPLPETALAIINPQPKVLFYQPGVQSIVSGAVSHSLPLSSGSILRSRISEQYSFFSGAEARPEPYTADLVFYQIEAPGPGIGATYPVTPSLPFEALSLKEGVIGVELYAPTAADETLPLIDQEGGAATAATGERLELKPGAVTDATAFRVTGLPASQLGMTLPAGLTAAGGVTLAFTGDLASSASISIPRPADLPAGSRVLLASIEEIAGESRFVLAGVGRIDGDRLVSDVVVPGASTALDGVRRAGRYVFLRVQNPVAFFTGVVSGVGGAPQGSVLVTSDRLPIVVSRSAADGRYVSAVLTGATTLTARDIAKNDTGTAQGTINDTWGVATLPLGLVAQRPAIVSISPGSNAIDVPLAAPVVVKFSEPIDPASLGTGGIVLTGPSGAVAASLTLSGNDTTATLRPTAALAPKTPFTISVNAAIKDLAGYALVSGASSTFESLDTAAPEPPPAGDIRAGIPVNGQVTVTASQGTAGSRDQVRIVNTTTGAMTPVTLQPNGGFTASIAAGLKDKLEIRILGVSGIETVVAIGRFTDPDGRVVITSEGGEIDAANGLRLTIAPGTFPDAAIVKFTALAPEAVAPTVPVGDAYPFVAAFEIDASVAPERYMNVSFPAPAGTTAASTGIVAEVVQVYGQRALSIVDTAKIINGRLATSSPPCEGIVNKFGRYAMYLNDHAQMRLGIALLSMTVPRMRPVVLAPFVVTNPFLPYPPTILHPGMQFEELYNPATPFIRYINATGDAEGGLAMATPVCFALPPDTTSRVVVRDAQTGAVIQSVSQTTPPAGQVATITALHVAPGDTTPPTVVWTSWNPRSPFVLDSGKPIQVQFSEAVTVGAPPNEDGAYLVNQQTGERLALQTRISPSGRVVTFLPQGALPIGTDYLLRIPGLRDLSGNQSAGALSFRTYQPTFVLPSVVQGVPAFFTRSHILNDFVVGGIDVVSSRLQSVALSDLDFVTRAPEENPTGKWQTTLFGIGNQREFGFNILSIDASQPRQPRAIGMLPGGVRFYNAMKVLPDFGLTLRTLPAGDPREAALTTWRTRELHYLSDNPAERVCAPQGDPRIAAWRARQSPTASFAMKSGCGTLGLVTSHNTYYSILHMYDLTNPVAPTLLAQRLLSDGGAIAGFPRKSEAPAATGGAARGVGLLGNVDFTHTVASQTWTHENATAAFVSVFGSGLTAVDLGFNIPEVDFRDRPPVSNVIEALQHWSFPYYQDARVMRDKVLAIANDQWDGTGTAHFEVFSAGLEPIGAPMPLPLNPYKMTSVEALLTFDEDGNGTPEEHDFAFITGKQGMAMIEVRAGGAAQLVGFVPMPNVPRDDRGLEVSRITGACPTLTFFVNDIKVRTDAASSYRRGSCADIVGGARVNLITVPNDGLLVTELTFLETPALLLVEGLRHVEIDKATKLAYIGGTWKKHDATYEGFVIVDVAIPYGGFTDRDQDGWDDRIRGFLPISGIGQPFASARLNGFRIDPRRKLIYAAIDSEPNDYDEANLVILKTCECAELEARITLQSGGAGTGPDRPSPDGSSATIFVTPEMLASGQFRALFDVESFSGADIHYSITELPITGDDADRLLDLSRGATGTMAGGSRSIRLDLRPAGNDPRGSVIAVDFTDAEGNFLHRAILNLVPTNVTAEAVKVRTFIDKTNQQIYETPAYLVFALNYDARVTIKIDGNVISPSGDGQSPGTPFVDVPLPAGLNRVLITRPMVSIPGEHQYEIRAVYEDGVQMVKTGKAIHEVTIDESLPVGHTFIKGVDLADGHLAISRDDLSIAGPGPALQFVRTYSNIGNRSGGVLGAGWSHNFESRLAIDAYGRISVIGGEGSGMRFSQVDGDASSPSTRVFKPQAGYHGQLAYTQGAYDYYTKARTRYHYELSPDQQGDPEYRLTWVEDPNGNRMTLTYTGLLLTKVTDAAGRTLTFTYEPHGVPADERITRVDGPMDLEVTFEYDEFGNLITASRANRVERYVYSTAQPRDRHNLTRATDPNGRHTDYTYFAQGDTFPGETPEFQWGRDILQIPLKSELVKRVTEGAETPEAATTSFAFDYSQLSVRYLTTVIDANQVETRYTLNPRGSVSEVRVVTADGENVTTMRWAFEDGINDVYMTRKSDPNGRVTRYEYDARGNMSREIIETSVPGYAPVTDAAGNPATEVVSSWEYEPAFNRLVKKVDPEGNITEYTIDPANGNVVSVKTDPRDGAAPIVTHMTYGSFPGQGGTPLKGLLQTATDARSHVTTYRNYDGWGNPTEIEDAEGHLTTQVFDERGRMTKVSDSMGHRVETVYDELDRVTKTTRFAMAQPPAAGMSSPDRVTTTTYFPGGQKKVITDGLDHETEYEYDGQNRPRRQIDRLLDGNGDEITLEKSWEYDGNGNRRAEIDRRAIRREYTFDGLNRERKVEVVDNGTPKRIAEQEYDAAGNLVAETDLHGHRTAYTLDGLYRRVKVDLPLTPYVVAMTYDLAGHELSVADANGRVTRRTYDGVYRRRTETDAAGNTVRFTYDPAGNVLTETHDRTGLVRRHGPYDKVNRPLGSSIEFVDPITKSQVTYTTSSQFLDDEHAVVTTNPRNVSIKEVFNGFDQPIRRIVDPDGLALTTTIRYDANGNEAAIQDPEGDEPDVVRTFDGLGRKLRSQYLLGGDERTAYDGNDNVVRTVDKRGIEMRHEYDALDRETADILVESISNGGVELTMSTTAYDDPVSKTTTTDAKAQATVTQFDALHREVRTTDAADQVTVTTWDGVVKRSVTSPRGLKREFDYDALNRVTAIRELDAAGGVQTSMATEYREAELKQIETDRRGAQRIVQFDPLRRVRQVSRRHAGLAAPYGADEIVTDRFEYDGNGNVVESVDANNQVTRYEYDAAERRHRVTEGVGSPVAATTTFTYDGVGNVLTVKDGRAHGGAADVVNTYDDRYRKVTETNAEAEVTRTTYNQNDDVETVTEPRGASFVTRYDYDEVGRVIAVDQTRGGAGGVTRFLYDANRNKIAQQDPSGNLTTYVHDAVNRLTDMFEHTVAGALTAGTTRSAGAGGDPASAQHWHYEYDADGNERLLVDAEGQRVVKTYDHLNRLVRRDYSNHKAASDGSAVYPQPVSIASTLDGNGNATRVDEVKRPDASNTVTETTNMAFDPLDRMVSRTNPDSKTVAYAFDRRGNRLAVTDADNLRTAYTYDARNRVSTATVNGGVTRYTYWPDSLIETTTYPNGVVSTNAYDKADRVTSIVSHSGDAASPVARHDYTYDDNGNTLTQTDTHRLLTSGTPQQTTYEYDGLNRLASVHYPNGAAMTYTHAPNGNRLTETGTDPASNAAVNRTLAYNRVNQLTRILNHADAAASVTFSYDRNGNTREQRVGPLGEGDTISSPASTRQYEFDIRDKLALVREGSELTRFDYDFTGLRTKKTGLSQVRFIYDENALLQEYDPASGQTLLKYNYGAGLLSLDSVGAGGRQSYFYTFDALRSTAALTDQGGAIRASYLYDAFGALRQSADTTPNRRRYTGQYDDTETGLQYFGARYYDPAIGRFLSEDPYLGSENDPPSLHRYTYAHGNPLSFVDPTGYSAESASETMRDLAAWGKQVGTGVIKGIGAPVAGLLESGVKGLGDITMAGVGYLAIEATGHKYVDEIGELLQPMSTIGQAAAEKGTITAIKESATGFVRDSIKGTITLPLRIVEAAASGDPELLGMTMVEAVQAGAGLKAPLAKLAAPVVRTVERTAVAAKLMMYERVSKRGLGPRMEIKTGTITAQDAWALAGLCVQPGAVGCGVVGGLQNPSFSNLWKNVNSKSSLARGDKIYNPETRQFYKFQGDVDFLQYRKGSERFMQNYKLAGEVNARTTTPLLDTFKEHGVLGELLPPGMVPLEVAKAWWKQEGMPTGSPIRAHDYWKKGVNVEGVTLLDGKGRPINTTGTAAYLQKSGKPGVTRRGLEPQAFEIFNQVHLLDDMPKFPTGPEMFRTLGNSGLMNNEYEKRRSK